MTGAGDEVDEKLERLAAETAGIRASAHFSSRVMGALPAAAPSGLWLDVNAAAKWLMPVFAVAAAFAVVWAISAQEATSEAMASTETAELEW